MARVGADRALARGRRPRIAESSRDRDGFGRATELIARAMGTPWFLIALTLFCLLWMTWNTLSPPELRFDSAALGFTALTLVLSLQASYAAPLILLAQNRQDDRDRVQMEQDRQRAERNLADTEYLAREMVALRMAVQDLEAQLVKKDDLREQLDRILEHLERDRGACDSASPDDPAAPFHEAETAERA